VDVARRAKKREAAEPAAKSGKVSPVVQVLGAVIIIAVFGAIGVAGSILIGEVFGDDPVAAEPVPDFIGGEPPIERSAAADLLEGKSFEEMTDEERDLVVAEVKRVFDDAEFRARSEIEVIQSSFAAVDVVRRGGVTRAVRYYRYGARPDGDGTMMTTETVFFCDSEVDGFLDSFRIRKNVLNTNVDGSRIQETSQPFDRELTGVDWTQPIDLGFDELEGRRVHGVQLPFTSALGGSSTWQLWFDVENGRLLRRGELNTEAALVHDYRFDWRTPPRIEGGDDLKPPCEGELYPDAP
jgi:hypothetical protein